MGCGKPLAGATAGELGDTNQLPCSFSFTCSNFSVTTCMPRCQGVTAAARAFFLLLFKAMGSCTKCVIAHRQFFHMKRNQLQFGTPVYTDSHHLLSCVGTVVLKQ